VSGYSRYAQNLFRGEIVGVSVTRLRPCQHADAAAHRNPFGGGFDKRLVEEDRRRGGVLEVEVGVLPAFGKRRGEVALKVSLGQAVTVVEKAIHVSHISRYR